MILKPGQKLYSAVSEAQVVVVQAPSTEVDLHCGGAPMLTEAPGDAAATLDPSLGDGPQVGKRYADEEIGLELLCAKPGEGALMANGSVLPIKGAKPLPSSD